MKLTFRSGRVVWVRALDTCPGCLQYKEHSSGLPFIADLPRCWRDGEPTGAGRLWNLDYYWRERARKEFAWQQTIH